MGCKPKVLRNVRLFALLDDDELAVLAYLPSVPWAARKWPLDNDLVTKAALPFIECEQIHAGLAVSDISTALEFYTEKLGFQQGFTWGEPPTFAGVNLGKVQMFLAKGIPSPSHETGAAYFLVGDANELYEFHVANRVEVVHAIEDRPYGIRDYTVRDLYGYCLVFGHRIFNSGQAIKIERVDVPVRLEKRLAALLRDLADHKRTSVNSCLEEILLHTNEGVGPHTETTLHYIQELKKRHAIDYDSHASYRFVEE
jgi:catechol 2,3-dioxygenase-like lactoylglutathione lyase family enzyme